MGKRLFPILIVTVSIATSLLSPNGVRSISAQPALAAEATYFDDFSSYTPGSPPTGWLLRGADQVTPTVQEVGGSGPAYRLVDFPEVPWQYWGRSLLKNGLIPHAPYTVTVKLNFRQKVADRAGLTIAWNEANSNQIEIQPNVYGNDIEFRETYNGPIQSNPVVNSIGYIPISAFINYWLRVAVKDDSPGQGQLSVLWSTDGTNFREVINATGLHDLRGLVRISTAGPHLPHMYFDDFSVSQTRPQHPTLTKAPEGKAPNLIILVHGCCTDKASVSKWDEMAGEIARNIKGKTPEKWEIVVWDWSEDTTEPYPGPAYNKAELQAANLATAISPYPYTYVHMIGHSAGARLIDMAAKNLAALYNNVPSIKNKPFIHLTFLDAYTPNNDDYGYFENYPEHYAEHYVDRTFSQFPDWIVMTNTILPHAFNFDITDWTPNKDDRPLEFGHQWPHRWYKKSVTSSEFKYGYPLSLEGSGKNINELVNELSKYPPGGCIKLKSIAEIAKCN